MRTTTRDLRRMKQGGEKVTMLTAYDYATARLLDRAGVPVLLVGDSLGMTMLGYDSTLPVTLEEVLHHTRAVVRGAARALVVADMPFLSYQVDEASAVANAGRLLKEGGCQAVKLEGGEAIARTVRRLVEAGIPVMGHLGLTPQSIHQLGGYRTQAKGAAEAARLLRDAALLQESGAFSLVLECVPVQLGQAVTERLRIPVIGIGSGPHCDGQVQVFHDAFGLNADFTPRHAARYAALGDAITEGARRFMAEVGDGSFPAGEHASRMDDAALAQALGAG